MIIWKVLYTWISEKKLYIEEEEYKVTSLCLYNITLNNKYI